MARWSRIALSVLVVAIGGAHALAQEAGVPLPKVEPASDPAANAADKSAAPAAAAATPAAEDVRLTFNFRNQPWQNVLDWFAEQAGLSLLLEGPPPGTFNYRDTRSYTPAEALDVINSVLLTKGYTLVRRDRMLVLVNLEDGVPPNLVPDVPLEELDKRGEYELIRVLFPVWNMTPEQAAEEVQPLLGPQGKVVTLPQARQVQVTETAGRLRAIRTIINAVEQPDQGTAGVREFELKYISFEAAMPTIRQMLGIPAEAYSTPDGTMQITKSATGEKLLFRGNAQHAARLQEILRLIDVAEAAAGINGAPQLEVYSITAADPEAVVKVLQTLMRDDPNVTLATDPQSGNLVAYATPPQQATIRATIEQMQKDARQLDVIALTNVDPQVAVLAINKLFGSTGEEPDPKAPRVDADITTRSLLVRGTAGQVEQIRGLLRKLGETEEGATASQRNTQNVRMIPLSGSAARSAITQIEQIWPSVRPNRIRIVAPTATIPEYRPGDSRDANQPGPSAPANPSTRTDPAEMREIWQMLLEGNQSSLDRSEAGPTNESPMNFEDDSAELDKQPKSASAVFRYAGEQLTPATEPQVEPSESTQPPPANPPTVESTPAPTPGTTAAPATPQPGQLTLKSSKGAPIVIAPGPGGILLASDDLEALDELEEMLTAVAGRNAASGREYAVFYLKYSKAATIAEVLASIFGGSTGGSDKGLIGDLANNALGDVGGALMGDLLLGGGSSGGFTSAGVDIIPDARLNALVVHAKPADLDTIEQLLKVLDQRTGPENVEADGQARAIPVYNTTATKIAEIVQQLYSDRIAGGGAMSPQEMMKMIRGGPNTEQQIQKMSIAVDTRNNMLIVRAPDPLFDEVKALVAQLDETEADSPETTRVVSLKHTNSAAVQKALTSILNNVSTSTTTATASSQPSRGSGDDDDDSPEERARRAMRRNWEMIQEMRRASERFGGGGDRGGDGDRSRFFQGRGGPGGSEGFRSRGGDGDRGSGRSRGGRD